MRCARPADSRLADVLIAIRLATDLDSARGHLPAVGRHLRGPEQMARLQQVVEDEGATFVDANLLHAETYCPQDADFGDGEHLNRDGATRFSQAFAGMLKALDAGQDVRPL